MANRFHGIVGYGETVDKGVGVHGLVVREQDYYGNVLQNTKTFEDGDEVNPNVRVGNQISIIADQYAVEHFFAIIYVMWMGVLWSVRKVEVKSPRLILSLGSVYDGPTPRTP